MQIPFKWQKLRSGVFVWISILTGQQKKSTEMRPNKTLYIISNIPHVFRDFPSRALQTWIVWDRGTEIYHICARRTTGVFIQISHCFPPYKGLQKKPPSQALLANWQLITQRACVNWKYLRKRKWNFSASRGVEYPWNACLPTPTTRAVCSP